MNTLDKARELLAADVIELEDAHDNVLRLARAVVELSEALRTVEAIMCDRELCGHFLPEEIRGVTHAALARVTEEKP